MRPWAYFAIPFALFLAGTIRIGEIAYEHKMAPKWAKIEQGLAQFDTRAVRIIPRAILGGASKDIERVRKIANIQNDVQITRIENAHAYRLTKGRQTLIIVVGD